MRDIITVAKRELQNIFRNKGNIITIIIIPVIEVLLMAIVMLTYMQGSLEQQVNFEADGYVVNAPEIFKADLEELGVVQADTAEIGTIKDAVAKGEVDILVVFPMDFEISSDPDAMCDIEMWYNSSKTDSVYAYQYVNGVLDSARPNVFTVNSDETTKYDLIGEGDTFAFVLSQFYPMSALMGVLMIISLYAAFIVTSDKEIGFMNMLLITPVKRTHIALGKFAALFVICAVSTISILVGTLGTALMYPLMDLGGSANFEIITYIKFFVCIFSAGVASAGLGFFISTNAKEYSQSSVPNSLISMVVSFGSLATIIPSVAEFIKDADIIPYLIPMLNVSFCLQDVILSSESWTNIIAALAVNALLAIVMVLWAAKKFDDEKVMQV